MIALQEVALAKQKRFRRNSATSANKLVLNNASPTMSFALRLPLHLESSLDEGRLDPLSHVAVAPSRAVEFLKVDLP